MAALVGGLFSNMKYKSTFLRDNLLINDNILELSHRFKCKKVVSCLSTCVFPDKVRRVSEGLDEADNQVEYPLTEEKVHLGPPHGSNFGYAHGKRLVDVQNHAYNDQYGDMFTSVIPTNIFGEHDNYVSTDGTHELITRTCRTRTSFRVLCTNASLQRVRPVPHSADWQKTTPLSSSPVPANPSANSFTLATWPSS